MAESQDEKRWRQDADVLAEIGRCLEGQPSEIEVRLPRQLAEKALAAWDRDDDGGPLPPETVEQARVRDQAASLTLIGAALEQQGLPEEPEGVRLSAHVVGDALRSFWRDWV